MLCPLSVTDGWLAEFSKFCPSLRLLHYVGDKVHRRDLRRTLYDHVHKASTSSHSNVCYCVTEYFILGFILNRCMCIPSIFVTSFFFLSSFFFCMKQELSFDVLLTTYDIALMDQNFLSQIPWHYAIIDEAQHLKNPSSVNSHFI